MNTTFVYNYQGHLKIKAGDIQRVDLPLLIQIRDCNFTYNFPISDALIKIGTNSKLYI